MAENQEKIIPPSAEEEFNEFCYQERETRERSLSHMVKKIKENGRCRVADDIMQRIDQNINDFQEIVDGVSKSCFCSKSEAFRKVWPFYRKVFASLIIADENWQNLPENKKTKVKVKTITLYRRLSGS